MTSQHRTIATTDLIDLLDPSLGVARRDALAGRLLDTPSAALELRLLLALESSAGDLAAHLAPGTKARTPWLRMLLPAAAAALMLLVWPQQVRHGSQAEAVAVVSTVSDDILLSGSFEAASDQHFGGGFE